MPQHVHHAPDAGRRLAWACVLAAAIAVCLPDAAAAARAEAPLPSYRIFLTDGTPLLSLGEFTRTDGRIVFAVPVGTATNPDAVQVVSLPDEAIDWERTTRYTDAVRLQRFAASSGEKDYRDLVGMVARALSDMAFAPDAAAKLRVGEEARRRVIAWPAEHYGYRAQDVRELGMVIDDALADVRAGAGVQTFELSLVATVEPPSEPLLAEPALAESLRLASRAASALYMRKERLSLQQAILAVLERRKPELPSSAYKALARPLKETLSEEARLDREYARLDAQALSKARAFAAEGDIEAVERLVEDVRRKDAHLGARRAGEISRTLSSLVAMRDEAQQMRLALNRWQYRLATYKDYRSAIDRQFGDSSSLLNDLDAIRRLVGPSPKRLSSLSQRIGKIEVALLSLVPPDDLREAHESLVASLRFMREAVRLWGAALASNGMDVAHNASASAAGAALLLRTARAGIAAYFGRPTLP